MPTAWFLCQYELASIGSFQFRRCQLAAFSAQIQADGGTFQEAEVLGGRAIVKVSASAATLATIAATPGIRRIPLARLDDPLSSLTPGQRTALRTELTDMGYTLTELQAALGSDLGAITLGQLLRFAATRRLKPRLVNGAVVLDGPAQACRSIDDLDGSVA